MSARNLNTHIAVVCGGPGNEAEVSRVSGQTVATALQKTFSDVTILELDRDIAKNLLVVKPDVVFPVLHGPPGEDGTFQGLLELLHIPYVGSGVRASALAMDKIAAKQLFRLHHLPVAPDVVVERGQQDAIAVIHQQVGTDVVIKPATQGSAIGVSFAHDETTLQRGLAAAWTLDRRALVERRIVGKEVTCGVLERTGQEALPVLEVRTPSGSWYDYQHRYTSGLSEHLIPAPLPKDQYDRVQEIALVSFRALGCRDFARADFVVPDQGDPILLEVNTLPGMTPTSLFPDEAKAAGISMEELTAHLVRRAQSRA